MYTRSFYPEISESKIPKNYDGNAFRDTENSENRDTDDTFHDKAEQVSIFECAKEESKKEPRLSEGILSAIGRTPLFSNLIGKDGILPLRNISIPKIGTEEILILAAAAYLFFSGDGDKECAIMLLLLLLIN